MKIIADFQVHSYLSRATSKNMTLEGISQGAKVKGLDLMGTGDFSHPIWFNNLKEKLKEINETGIYQFNGVNFILTNEVNTVFEYQGKFRKIHHMIHAPSFEVVEQINEKISKYGNLKSDGRPTLNVSAAEIVENLIEISNEILIYSSHNWTPFFGAMGSKTGFNSLEECYQDQIKNIFALETGMSSDPAMNWRLSSLDKFTLLSSSDAHSPNPWRLGREANAFNFEQDEITYKNITDAIKNKDKNRFLFTVETDPNYGKYHFDGHRVCGFSCSPEQTKRLNGICPRCKRKLTVGVLNRVEQLADRPEGFVPKDAIPFKDLIPLYEIISFTLGVEKLYSQKVLEEQNKLINRFGNEFNVLLNVPREEMIKVTHEKIVDSILKLREGKVKFIAGYDGVYGKPIFNNIENLKDKISGMKIQSSLTDFDMNKGP